MLTALLRERTPSHRSPADRTSPSRSARSLRAARASGSHRTAASPGGSHTPHLKNSPSYSPPPASGTTSPYATDATYATYASLSLPRQQYRRADKCSTWLCRAGVEQTPVTPQSIVREGHSGSLSPSQKYPTGCSLSPSQRYGGAKIRATTTTLSSSSQSTVWGSKLRSIGKTRI